jgi:hypothetical protein
VGKTEVRFESLKIEQTAYCWISNTMDTSEFTHEFFEASSKAWKANKLRYGQASYKYKKNAFPKDTECPPLPPQSLASKKRTDAELIQRQSLDEFAPPRVRKSPRLREKEIQQVYSIND